MTENLNASRAKASYELLVALKQTYLLGQVGVILELAGMSEADLSGALRSNVVQPMQGAKKNASYYSAKDVLKLYFANMLAKEERARLSSKEGPGNIRFMWSNINTRSIATMVMKQTDELFYNTDDGQKVIEKMVEIAGYTNASEWFILGTNIE